MAISVVIAAVAVIGVLRLLGGLAAPPDDGAGTPVANPAASTPTPMRTPPPVEKDTRPSTPSTEPTAAPDPSASALEAAFTAAVKQRKALKDADPYKLGRLGWNMCEALEEGKGFAEAVVLGRSGFDEETSAYIATLAIGNLCPRQQDKIPG